MSFLCEPWRVDDFDGTSIADRDGDMCFNAGECMLGADELARVVACVNFCRELKTEFMQGKVAARVVGSGVGCRNCGCWLPMPDQVLSVVYLPEDRSPKEEPVVDCVQEECPGSGEEVTSWVCY